MRDFNRRRHLARGQRSQSLVEFALSLVFLVLLISGLLDLGRLYFVYTALEDAAGEGALYLSINPLCRTAASNPDRCKNPGNAQYRIYHSGGGLVDWSACTDCVNIRYVHPSDLGGSDIYPNYGMSDVVIVTITYQFPLLTPAIPQIVGASTLPLTVVATQSLVNQ